MDRLCAEGGVEIWRRTNWMAAGGKSQTSVMFQAATWTAQSYQCRATNLSANGLSSPSKTWMRRGSCLRATLMQFVSERLVATRVYKRTKKTCSAPTVQDSSSDNDSSEDEGNEDNTIESHPSKRHHSGSSSSSNESSSGERDD